MECIDKLIVVFKLHDQRSSGAALHFEQVLIIPHSLSPLCSYDDLHQGEMRSYVGG